MIPARVTIRFARVGIAAAIAACAVVAEQSTAWISVTPSRPVRGDSVQLRLVLGDTLQGCAPRFDSMSCSFRDARPVAGHPCVQITLRYRTIPADSATPHGPDTVRYGPVFELGGLDSGYYVIYDGTNWDSLALWYIPVDSGTGPRIDGTVRGVAAEVAPLAGARVYLYTPDGVYASAAKARSDIPFDALRLARSDSAGRYSFADIADGIYRIDIVRPGYTSWRTQKAVSSHRTIDAELVKLGTFAVIEGSVSMLDCPPDSIAPACPRVPVEGCALSVGGLCGTVVGGSHGYLGPPCSAFTDTAGIFRIDSVKITDSATSVFANHPFFHPETLSLRLRPDRVTHADFIVKPSYRHRATRTAGSLTFTLRSSTRSYPPGGWLAFCYDVRNTGVADTTISFAEACLPLGRYQIDYRVEYDAGVQLSPSVTCDPLCLAVTLEPGQTVRRGPESIGPIGTAGSSLDSACIVAWLREYREISEVRLWVYFEDTATAAHTIEPARPSPRLRCRLRGADIVLQLQSSERLSVVRYDLRGRRIAVILAPTRLPGGIHTIGLSSPAPARPSVLRISADAGERALLITAP